MSVLDEPDESAPSQIEPTESALVIVAPELDAVVGKHRRELDEAAGWGVPAHLTVLYPFVAPDQVDNDVLERIRRTVAEVKAFDCTFARTDWFGEEVLWLAPEPVDPFKTLTELLAAGFPDHQPYSGDYDEVVPHLTIGYRRFGDLKAAEAEISKELPVRQPITEVAWIVGAQMPGSWRTAATFPLRDGS